MPDPTESLRAVLHQTGLALKDTAWVLENAHRPHMEVAAHLHEELEVAKSSLATALERLEAAERVDARFGPAIEKAKKHRREGTWRAMAIAYHDALAQENP